MKEKIHTHSIYFNGDALQSFIKLFNFQNKILSHDFIKDVSFPKSYKSIHGESSHIVELLLKEYKYSKPIKISSNIFDYCGELGYDLEFLFYYSSCGFCIEPFFIVPQDIDYSEIVKGLCIVEDDYLMAVSGTYFSGKDILAFSVGSRYGCNTYVIEDMSNYMTGDDFIDKIQIGDLRKCLTNSEDSAELEIKLAKNILESACEISKHNRIRPYEDTLDYMYEESDNSTYDISEDELLHNVPSDWHIFQDDL